MALAGILVGMLRLATAAFFIIILSLVGLALLPTQPQVNPDEDVQLSASRMVLYPQGDPGAVWRFAAQHIRYNPVSREAHLYELDEGARLVAGEVDFSLRSPQLIIDRRDNIRSDDVLVHITDLDWDLHMRAKDQRPVEIRQGDGKRPGIFIAPRYYASGEGLGEGNIEENVQVNFDLTDFRAGGRGTVGNNSFIDRRD